ncbi:MAG: DUF167 domain-containing protein [Candidatus Spechtbacterales bacterium]|nr:DUF167 domain-containing protein [Candidatus Spechtbacterales bacterium]
MKISVKVKIGARQAGVQKISENSYKVAVKARPEKGRANKEVCEVLAEYFDIAKNRVQITSGHKSVNKIIEIR